MPDIGGAVNRRARRPSVRALRPALGGGLARLGRGRHWLAPEHPHNDIIRVLSAEVPMSENWSWRTLEHAARNTEDLEPDQAETEPKSRRNGKGR